MSASARALRVTHTIHDLGPGGAEHVLVDLARVAPKTGMDMSVISLMPIDGLGYPSALRELGVEVRALDLKAAWDPRGPGRMRSALASLRPDIVHSHLKHADVVTAVAQRGSGLPQISTLHVIEDDVSGIARLKRDVAAKVRNRAASRIVAVSDAVRRWYVEECAGDPRRVVTVRNGIPAPPPFDATWREEHRHRLGVDSNTVLAAMVAVMRPGKGHHLLLDAAALLTREVEVAFVLAGDGPLEDEIRTHAGRLAGDRVIFAGFVDDVPGLLAACDLVVHPSRADALPTALIHGLAAGLPAIACNVGGVAEVVGPDAGTLVAPGDAAAIADATIALAADPDRRRWMGKRARERYDERFEATQWAGRLIDIYQSAIHSVGE